MEAGDILRDLGPLALGSRLKRLSDRLLADAARIHRESEHHLPPGQFPLIAALDRYGPMTVNDAAAALGVSQPAATRAASEAVKCGLVESESPASDRRVRRLSLTDFGAESVARMKFEMWPRMEAAARALTRGASGQLLRDLAVIEDRLAERSLLDRYADHALRIVDYTDALAPAFLRINRQWIDEMFTMEAHDRHVLENPRETIIDPGGHILFVEDLDGTVLGACALQRDEDGGTELTKMGVTPEARGRGAGEFLLRAVLERARELGLLGGLYLLTNTLCGPAIRLYEKVGFQHDAELLARYRKRYERADVAMRFAPDAAAGQ